MRFVDYPLQFSGNTGHFFMNTVTVRGFDQHIVRIFILMRIAHDRQIPPPDITRKQNGARFPALLHLDTD